ncbi:MAG: HAMP domain-containing sensor histidine kinase [SAR202 cluster bacterium]|jgi:signal transduction histidine kinase|nr:HAMP domain-containing sensor histidine kinase [SAR202 cluster bacterium]
MIPDSIRWRLPLSYAGIALLAALLLGVILLLALRGYYSRRENDYLLSNARAISSNVSFFTGLGSAQSALDAHVKLLAFTSQTRVKVFDSDGDLLSDSGDLRDIEGLGTLSVGLEVDGVSESFSQTVNEAEQQREFTSSIKVEESTAQGVNSRMQIETSVTVKGDVEQAGGSPRGGSEPLSLVPAVGAQLGLDLDPGDETGIRRSDKTVREPILSELGAPNGYVELTQGPAFGSEVLASVAWGWAVSSALAVVLAGGAGWLMSLRLTRPLTSLTDTTSRMAQGELSTRANVQRGDELGQLAGSFNEMAQRVESTVNTLQRFVGDAAHQILTPLTALRTDLDTLRQDPDNPNRDALIVRATAQLDRLQELSDNLLSLSRLEAGVGSDERSEVDLNALLADLGETFASRAEQAGLEFSLKIESRISTIQANESQLRQAVGNLIDNAIKFTLPGGEVSVTLQSTDAEAIVTVDDTGVGIPDQDIPHLFERFHRGRNASSHTGNGLGLAIVQAIADAHNATVTVENTERGARFRLFLAFPSQ